MSPTQEHTGSPQPARSSRRNERGFTLVELIISCLIGVILTAMAVPHVQSVVNNYRLNSAVAMAKWAIQSTRFQALSKGYNYQVAFTSANQSYQIQNLPSGTTYSNVGPVVQLSSWPMTVNQDSTITFQPNGFVTATNSSFTITYHGVTATIAVSNYGNVTVTCSNNTTTC
jgi:prepilin-type N-terminal cleavage/methylation domain-containing protein